VRRDTLAELRRALAEKRPVVLATELATGEERLLFPFAPGDRADPLVAAAREAAARDASGPVGLAGADWFLRVYNPPVRVAIVGAVHVSQALVPICLAAGYGVELVDPRRAFATAERFRGVEVATEWPDAALSRLRLDRRTAVVALTHDPKLDDPALAAALRSEAFYVGALGSRRSHAARLERLRGEGFSEADLTRIRGPVGLPLGAVSPGEIAVSIAAEIVGELRRGGRGGAT